MKKILSVLLVLALALTGVFAQPAAETTSAKTEIVVFAAASMTETLTTIKGMYEAANPNVTITYNFDSS